MTNLRTLFLGAAAGIVATVAGLQLAHADCSQDYEPTYAQARQDADECDTNYGEVVRTDRGFEAYCVPDDVAEGCIEVSYLLDCSVMSAARCDDEMGRMFEACLSLQAGAR